MVHENIRVYVGDFSDFLDSLRISLPSLFRMRRTRWFPHFHL